HGRRVTPRPHLLRRLELALPPTTAGQRSPLKRPGSRTPRCERGVYRRRPAARLAVVVHLVIEQVTEFVQESKCDAPADTRDAEIDRVAPAEPIRTGLGDRGRRPHRDRLEI